MASANDILVNLRFNYAEVNKAVNKINKSFKKMDGVASTVKKQQVEVTKMTAALNNMGLAGNSVGGIFGKLFAKVGVWLGITTVVYSLIRGISSLFTEMKSLEDLTVRLQRVMVGTRDEVEANTKSTYAFAKSMNALAAATYDETLVAMEATVKAGFRFADAMTLARTSLIAANVTELSTADATRFLIATIRQFNLTATDSLNVLDQWNELGKKTGATSQGIAEAVSRSGLAFRSVGGTLSQLNAITAAVMETTGESGEKIGTSMKTISSRFADLGRKMSLNNELSKVGINIQKANTREQDDFLTVMANLTGKWDSLTKAQQANIAKAAAGIRQYTRFMAIVKNFDGVIRALLVTINSSNSALSENEIRAKSLDFKLKQLKGSFQEIALSSQGLLNVVKNLTDLLIPLVKAFGVIASSKITAFILSAVGVFGGLNLAIMGTSKAITFLIPLLTKLTIGGGPVGMIIAGFSALAAVFLTVSSNARKLRDDMNFAFSNIASDVKASVNNTKELIKNTELFMTLLKRQGTAPDIISGITEAYETRGISARDLQNLSPSQIVEQLNQQVKPGNIIDQYITKLQETVPLTDEVRESYSRIKEEFNNKGDSGGLDFLRSELKKLNTETKETEEKISKLSFLENTGLFAKKGLVYFSKLSTEVQASLMSLFSPEEAEKYRKVMSASQFAVLSKDIKLKKQGQDLQKEQLQALLSTLETSKDFNSVIEQAQLEHRKLLGITKNIYSTWVDMLFELKEGQSLIDNMGNAFMNIGKIIYDEIKNSMVEGFIAGMEGIEAIATMKNTIKELSQQLFMGVGNFFDELNYSMQPRGILGEDGKIIKTGMVKMKTGNLGDMLKTGIVGAGLGGFTASATGKDAGSGAGLGTIGALIGSLGGPAGIAIGGLLGGLFASEEKDKTNKDVDESLKYQRESTKELKEVNRNLVLMRQDLRPWEYISDSYFFSQATNRGFVGA